MTMMSITRFSKRFNLSRSSLLYYERIGLLMPCTRSQHGYRYYGEKAELRLQSILAYKAYGIELGKIAHLRNLRLSHFFSVFSEKASSKASL